MFIQYFDTGCTETIKVVATLKARYYTMVKGEVWYVIQLVYAIKILIISRF